MAQMYTPALRWKRGERAALAFLSPAGRHNVKPFFLLGADNFKDKKATNKVDAIPAPQVFAAELDRIWGKTEFYLDASPVPLDSTGVHPLAAIAAEVRSRGGRLVPATFLAASSQYQAAVHTAQSIHSAGVCLRVSLSEMTSANSWLSNWTTPLNLTDLVVDIGDSAENVLALGDAVNGAFAALAKGPAWRSVTIIGTSMPENFAGLAAGTHLQPRHEFKLWQQLVASGLPYPLVYGDYATVSTATPAPGIAWGYPITVKYTLPSDFLVCRGVRTKGIGAKDMAPQLVGHAKAITLYSGRGPLSTCWADNQIDRIASGKEAPHNLEYWVSLAVNRHIELVRSTLP